MVRIQWHFVVLSFNPTVAFWDPHKRLFMVDSSYNVPLQGDYAFNQHLSTSHQIQNNYLFDWY